MNTPVDVICSNELTTFPNRKTAIKFFYECMAMCEGAERERYTNIYMALTSSKSKMVSDEDYFTEPMIYRVGKFVGDHCENLEKLPKPMTYKQYLKYKESQEKENNKYYILDIRLNKEQRKYFEDKGYFCYDMRESCLYGDGGWVERYVLINNCGSIITNKDLGLNEKNYAMRLDDLMDNFKEMSYEEYQELTKDNEYEFNY